MDLSPIAAGDVPNLEHAAANPGIDTFEVVPHLTIREGCLLAAVDRLKAPVG
jgi:hypothetical protein